MRRLLPLALLLSLSACKEPEPPAQVIRPAQVWTVSGQAEGVSATFSGEVKARHEADLAFRVGGKVKARQAEVGQMVEAGQVLARLDTADLELGLASARASLAAAEAERTNARRELDRLKPLHAQKFIGQSALDAAQAAFEAAEAKVNAARAQVNLSANQARYTDLVADKPGVITQIHAEVGQVVAAGTPVFHIAYDGEREVQVRVGETTASSLPPSMAVQVKLWSQPGTPLEGTVREVAPSTDATRSVLIKVSLKQPPADLRLGISADIALPASAASDQRWLPATALFQQGDKAAVWVFDANDSLHLAPVSVHAYREDGVLVSGLAAGTRILAAGVHAVTEGQQVRPIPYDGVFTPSPLAGEGRGEGEARPASHPLPNPPPSRGREPSGHDANAGQ